MCHACVLQVCSTEDDICSNSGLPTLACHQSRAPRALIFVSNKLPSPRSATSVKWVELELRSNGVLDDSRVRCGARQRRGYHLNSTHLDGRASARPSCMSIRYRLSFDIIYYTSKSRRDISTAKRLRGRERVGHACTRPEAGPVPPLSPAEEQMDVEQQLAKMQKTATADQAPAADAPKKQFEDLHSYLDLSKCSVLNAADTSMLTNVLQGTAEGNAIIKSDCDEQLLFGLVFKQPVRLQSIGLSAPSAAPKTVKIFANKGMPSAAAPRPVCEVTWPMMPPKRPSQRASQACLHTPDAFALPQTTCPLRTSRACQRRRRSRLRVIITCRSRCSLSNSRTSTA